MEKVKVTKVKLREGNGPKGAWRSISIRVPDGRWMSCFARGHTDPVLLLQEGDEVQVQTEFKKSDKGEFWNFVLVSPPDRPVVAPQAPERHETPEQVVDTDPALLVALQNVYDKLEEMNRNVQTVVNHVTKTPLDDF